MSIMPPRPTQVHGLYNPDAANLRQAPGTADINQQMMLQQQAGQDVRAKMEDQLPQAQVAMNEDVRGANMNMDSQQAHADARAMSAKDNVLKALEMKGVPLEGMQNIQAVARQMGIG